jgi:riboflavin kinase/FMN adenylyltransferase
MNILRDWKKARLRRTAVAIGVFDGVHRGHLAILAAAAAEAKHRGLRPVALTMDPHPSSVLRPDAKTQLLYSLEHRLELLKAAGIRTAVILRFDRALARMSARDFSRKILGERLDAKAVFVGTNFRFGRGAEGDAAFLQKEGALQGYTVRAVRPVRSGSGPVSSSRIRSAVAAGRFAEVRRLLGRDYSLFGTVVRGDGRGRRLGFPTLNLLLDHELLPPPGVYAVRARSGRDEYPGVFHLGPRPTFDSSAIRAECHLLKAPKASLYGRRFELVPVKHLRPVRRFASPEALAAQIARDVRSARLALQRPLKRVY